MNAIPSIFVCYSHKDQRWLNRLLVHLKPLERAGRIDPWADTRILPGDTWVEEISGALARADLAVLLVSADFLASEFIASKELPRLLQKAGADDCKIMPLIVGPCLFTHMRDLQQFQAVNPPEKPLTKLRKPEAEEVLVALAENIFQFAAQSDKGQRPALRGHRGQHGATMTFVGDKHIDTLLHGIRLADWDLAADAALTIVAETEPIGTNPSFESLLDYQDCKETDRFWAALQTIECCARLAPWLVNHEKLSRMASHENFSVRSTAASICMELAHSAPDRVPLNLLLRLSAYDEDWYVEAPANAAIKAMAHSFPDVLRVYYHRLHSNDPDERLHATAAIEDVARNDPHALDPELLRAESCRLRQMGDDESRSRIRKVLARIKARGRGPHRYGL